MPTQSPSESFSGSLLLFFSIYGYSYLLLTLVDSTPKSIVMKPKNEVVAESGWIVR
jgi:hypothetical protein